MQQRREYEKEQLGEAAAVTAAAVTAAAAVTVAAAAGGVGKCGLIKRAGGMRSICSHI